MSRKILYAIVLAGVPSDTAIEVLNKLRKKYQNRHAIAGLRASKCDDSMADYNDNVVNQIMKVAVNVIFEKTAQPWGFCDGPDEHCALKQDKAGKIKSCKRDARYSCAIRKPDRFIVLYQQGINEESLLRRLHYSAFTYRIPQDCYGDTNKTFEVADSVISLAREQFGRLDRAMKSKSSPLLLPPINFGLKSLKNLLSQVMSDCDLLPLVKRFEQEYYKSNNDTGKGGYRGRNSLIFPPPDHKHALARIENDEEIAISKHYRLGCRYEESHHYDVGTISGRDLDGSIHFYCRKTKSSTKPKAPKVSIFVDDSIR
jgi:hypothetical protein